MAPVLISIAAFLSALAFVIWLAWFVLNTAFDTSRTNRQEKTFQVGIWLIFGGCLFVLALGFYLILVYAYPDQAFMDAFQIKGSL